MELNRLTLNGVPLAPVPAGGTTPAEAAKSFSAYLSDAMDELNQAQVESGRLADQFAAGQVQDVHQVTIASQKAAISLQLAVQVRNKVIEAYQEIMRMPM